MAGIAPVNPKLQFKDSVGVPLVGGTLDVYLAGTTTRTNTWQDKTQSTLNTNPVVLDSRGECTVWVDDDLTYKFVLKNALGVTQWTVDNVSGVSVSGTLVSFTQSGSGAVVRTMLDKARETVSLEDFGAVGDGTTDDSAAIQLALDVGGAITLKSGKTYYGSSETLSFTGPTRIIGNGAIFKDCLFNADSGVDVVSLEGVKFTTGITSGTEPPYVFNPRNLDFVTLRDCEFNNVMVYIATDDAALHYRVVVENCRFIADWTDFNPTTLQHDCLTVAGYQDIIIRGNYFSIHNVTRCLKLTSGNAASELPVGNPVPITMARGLFITDNFFNGDCTKQLADCFSGTIDFIFANNYIKVTGATRGVENKTGYSYTTTGIATSHKVVNNYFEMACSAVYFQGCYGVTDWSQNSYDNLLVSGNTFNISTEDEGSLHARFLNSLVASNNEFTCVAAITSKYHMDIRSCEKIVVNGNTLDGGSILIGKATSNAQTQTFDSMPKHIAVTGNVFRNYNIAAAVSVEESTVENLVIGSNIAVTDQDNVNMQSAYWIRGCTVTNATVNGNTALHSAASAKALLSCTNSTITRLIEEGNSWYPALKNLANSATPSVKAVSSSTSVAGGDLWQTGGTTTITNFTDGFVGQTLRIRANHSVTIQHGSGIRLAGAVDFAMTLHDTLTLTQFISGDWLEVARSVN